MSLRVKFLILIAGAIVTPVFVFLIAYQFDTQLRPFGDYREMIASQRAWRKVNGFLFATGVPITLLCLGALLFAAYLRWPLDMSKPDIGDFEYQRDIESLSLAESWDAWVSMRSVKLENRPTPLYLIHRQRAGQLQAMMIVSVSGMVLGLACVVASLLLGRQSGP